MDNITDCNGVVFSPDKKTLIRVPETMKGVYEVPFGVTSIGGMAFLRCRNLTEVIIPNSVTRICEAAFESSGITNLALPDSVTTIDPYAFLGCHRLENVSIPDSVVELSSEAFCECVNLQMVHMPSRFADKMAFPPRFRLGWVNYGMPIPRMSPPIRFLAISDIHKSGMEGIDPAGCAAMLVAGDFLEKRHYDSAKDLNNDPFFSWCKANPDVLVFLTAGNHDRPAERHRDWFDWPKNVIRLHEDTRIVLFKGLRIFGTPWTEQHGNGVFQVEKDALPAKYAVIPKDLDIIVAHATPLLEGTGSDADVRPGYGHIGSEALRDAIREKKPKVVVCGHVHAKDHAIATIGGTKVVNVSRIGGADRNGQAAFSPTIVEFGADGSIHIDPAKRL